MDNTFERHLTAILDKTFSVIDTIYQCNSESSGKTLKENAGSRIIFPSYSKQYRKGEIRVSEQELRFVFVEQFNKYCDNTVDFDAFYSVETPTEEKYNFSDKSNPHKVLSSDNDKIKGQSAMVDLTIHSASGERLCLMEFKSHNPEPFAYKKDFAKLNGEGAPGIFVQILVNADDRTIKSIREKTQGLEGTGYVCHCMNTKKTYFKNLSTPLAGWKTI